MATKSFYFSNTPNDATVVDSVQAFIKQTGTDLVCDCNSQEFILSNAINMYVSGNCIYGSTGNTGCGNSLEYLWMKCNVDGTNCSEQTGWRSGGSGSLCPSTAGWYTFCVRFAGCYSTNVGEVPVQYVGGGGGGGGCNVSASISGTTTFCSGSSTTLTATGSGSSGYSYSWTTGSSSRSITVYSGGYYGVTITDANGCTANAGVQVTAQSCNTNHAPTCSSVSATTCGTTPVSRNFSGSDVDGDALTYSIVTQPSSGSVTKSGSTFTYTPSASTAAGSYSFTYRVSDGSLTSSACTVNITVTTCNNAPTCSSVNVSTCLGAAVTGNFSGNDPDGNALTYTIVSQPSSGSVTKSGSSFTYTPSGTTTGTFSFTYRVSDGTLTSSSCTASIVVTACNNAPTCNSVNTSTCQGVAVTGNFSGNDPDGNALTYSIVTAPNASTEGSVTISGSQFTFTPVSTATGTITFTYKVTDIQSLSSSNCIVTIVINPKPAVTNYLTCEVTYQLPTTGGITWSVAAGTSASVTSGGLISGMTFDGVYNFIANLGGCITTISVTKSTCGCIKPDAGIDISMCLPKTTTNLVDAPAGYQWVASASNPIATNVNASTGLVSGMTVVGTYQYILQKIGDITCFNNVQVAVMPENPPIVICNDGISSFRMIAPTYLSNVIWYNLAGQQVGTGSSLVVTSNTLGLADGSETFYYKGDFGTPNVCECDIELCCPIKITTKYCCLTPNCIDISAVK